MAVLFKSEGVRLFLCLLYVFAFLTGTGYAFLSWMDEGPSYQYVPRSSGHTYHAE